MRKKAEIDIRDFLGQRCCFLIPGWANWPPEFDLRTDAYTDRFLDCYGREHFEMKMPHVAAFKLFG